MKRIIYIALLLFWPVIANSQIRIIDTGKKTENATEQQNEQNGNKIKKNKTNDHTTKDKLSDTVYCLNTKKQHGWFSPIETIEKEKARKKGNYFMFTKRNAQGHWTRMETFNGNDEPTWLGGNPYIMNTEDPLGDKEWINKVKTGCITEMIADPSGNTVIQERSYDRDMNLIYTFSRVPIGDKQFIGSYKDFFGLPAEMRNDTTLSFTYGTLVIITEDQWGNDSIVEYVDSKGVPKNNYDGVGRSVFFHDKKGRQIGHGSSDHNGNLVIDNKGNCGWEYTFDDKTGLITEGICMDQNWKPIPMPQNGMTDGSTTGVTRIVYQYDAFGRNIEEKYMTLDNKPDTNIYGAHRIVSTYDNYGNALSMTGYGINGKLAAIDASGTARYNAQYDEKGRCTYIEWFDKNNKLVSTPGSFCSDKEVFGPDGLLDEEMICSINNGKIDTSYHYLRTYDYRYEKYIDGTYRIDSLDKKGRTTMFAFYYTDGSPFFNKDIGFQRSETRYIDNGKQVCEITKHYDASKNLCGNDAICEIFIDSVELTKRIFKYDADGRITESYILKFDKDNFSHLVGQYDMNQFGMVCRSGGSSGVRYYNADILWTQKGEISSLIGRDEFGEPDYINTIWGTDRKNNGLLYYYQIMRNGSSIFYDENSRPITDVSGFIDKCPKAMSIEVTDSIAYKLGIKDNDIIMRYGKDYQLIDNLDYHSFLGAWITAQIFEASNEKEVLLFRVDPKTKEYGIVTIILPKGNPSDLGFVAHPIFRTQKQKDRQTEAIDNYCKQCKKTGIKCLWESNIPQVEKNKTVVFAFSEICREYQYYPYPNRVVDPSIVMAFSLPEIEKKWFFGQDFSDFSEVFYTRLNSLISPTLTLYYVKDGITLQQESFSESNLWVHFFQYTVTDAQYNQLKQLTAQTKELVKKEEKGIESNQADKNQLCGKWRSTITQENTKANLTLTLFKNGSANVQYDIDLEGESEGSLMSLSFILSMKSCKWFLQNHVLTLLSEGNVVLELIDFDMEGISKKDKKRMRSIFKEHKKEFLESNEFKDFVFDIKGFLIKDIIKDELILDDGDEMVFYRVK